MMRNIFLSLLFALFAATTISCTSVDTQTEDDVMALDDAGAENSDSADEFADENEFEESTFGEEPSETAASEDLESDFAEVDEQALEEPVSEEISEDMSDFVEEEVAQEELALEPEPLLEEPVAEEPLQEFVTDAPSSSSGPSADIRDIKYLANQSGGSIVIEASGPLTYQTRLNPSTNQFIIEIPKARLPESLKRPYILKEFNAAFGAINSYQNPGSETARVVVQLKGKGAEPFVQVEGNSLVVIPSEGSPDLMAQAPAEAAAAQASQASAAKNVQAKEDQILAARTLNEFLTGQTRFYGREISIQVKDGDIRDVLNFVADESGMNMVISEDVQGRISLKLRRIPWDQALVTVMRAKGLGYVRQGSVIRISTLNSLQQETDAAKRMIDSQKTISPTRVRVVPVSYASVDDLAKQVTPFLTKDRGSVLSDPRTSSVIVTDTDEVLERVGRLIKELDIPPPQVMIEGKIVEAGETFAQNVGINWSMSGSDIQLSSGGGANGGPVTLTPSLSVTNLDPTVAAGSPFNMDLKLGTLDVLGDLAATLSLLERDSLVKILSSPRVVAMNREKATITQKGENVTIVNIVDNIGTRTKSVKRDPVIIELIVTPQVTADGSVIMDVDMTREFTGPTLDQETQARAINSRKAKTKIMVKNGQTAVIGGIYQSDQAEAETGVPVLKNIPVLGWLFKSKSKEHSKNELLIFLTPKILNLKDQVADLSR